MGLRRGGSVLAGSLDRLADREGLEARREGDGSLVQPVLGRNILPDHSETRVHVLANFVDSYKASPTLARTHLPIGLRHRVAQEGRDVDSTDLDFGWGRGQVVGDALLDFGSGIGALTLREPDPKGKTRLDNAPSHFDIGGQVAAIAALETDEGQVEKGVSLDWR